MEVYISYPLIVFVFFIGLGYTIKDENVHRYEVREKERERERKREKEREREWQREWERERVKEKKSLGIIFLDGVRNVKKNIKLLLNRWGLYRTFLYFEKWIKEHLSNYLYNIYLSISREDIQPPCDAFNLWTLKLNKDPLIEKRPFLRKI